MCNNPNTKTITVSQVDIDNARQSDGDACALARAFQRQGFPNAYVSAKYLYPDGCSREKIELPIKAQRFVLSFDAGFPVKPFEFEIPHSFLEAVLHA